MAKDVTEFLQECSKLGIEDYDKIIERAKELIAEKDQKLHEADGHRIEKIKLLNILRELGDDSFKRKRASASAPVIELDDNSLNAKHLRFKICNVIESDGALTNRDIIQKIGGYQEEQRVIRAIKFLGEQGILARDTERRHVPGPNWEQRPSDEPASE